MNEKERALRTLMQVVVSAGFAEAVNAWVISLDPSLRLAVMVLMTFVVSYAQNWLEDHGYVKPVLKRDRTDGISAGRDPVRDPGEPGPDLVR